MQIPKSKPIPISGENSIKSKKDNDLVEMKKPRKNEEEMNLSIINTNTHNNNIKKEVRSYNELPIGVEFIDDEGKLVKRYSEDTVLIKSSVSEEYLLLTNGFGSKSISVTKLNEVGSISDKDHHSDSEEEIDDSGMNRKSIFKNTGHLLQGEEFLMDFSEFAVNLQRGEERVGGRLCITNYRLIFISKLFLKKKPRSSLESPFDIRKNLGSESQFPLKKRTHSLYQKTKTFDDIKTDKIIVPLANVDRTKISVMKMGNELILKIYCKNFRVYSFHITGPISFEGELINYLTDEYHNVPLFKYTFFEMHETLINLLKKSKQTPLSEVFAFSYKEVFKTDGWGVYDDYKEIERIFNYRFEENEDWRLSTINSDFTFCPTYPKHFVVPSAISDNALMEIRKFRSKNRIPYFSWIDLNSNATLFRCSQPLSGVSGTRNMQDEKFFETILKLSKKESVYILDSRPWVNAAGNKMIGAGYENPSNYKNCIIEWMGIKNIHDVRESQNNLMKVCHKMRKDFFSDPEKFIKAVNNTGWTTIISLILKASLSVAQKVTDGYPVVVHCSDGWDRTSQMTSLGMLLMDPYYRTLIGFQVLIEKEWISVGHKFTIRCGNGDNHLETNERSPIFLQFIDCTYQILSQFPEHFEFNEKFLIVICQHLTSCRFGTFLCNNEKQRETTKLRFNTRSLWSYINSHKYKYINNTCKNVSASPSWATDDLSTSNEPTWAKSNTESEDGSITENNNHKFFPTTMVPKEKMNFLLTPKFDVKELRFFSGYYLDI